MTMPDDVSVMTLEGGALTVLGEPDIALRRALAVIGRHLHRSFFEDAGLLPRQSFGCCILCAVTVRDFLQRAGIPARVRSITALMRLDGPTGSLHSLGIGVPGQVSDTEGGRWAGHTVVEARGFLIDPALAQFRREIWSWLPDIVAFPRSSDGTRTFGLPMLGAWHYEPRGAVPTVFNCVYLDNPRNDAWQTAPDASATNADLREPVIARLIAAYQRGGN
jgi:hypothetical protein